MKNQYRLNQKNRQMERLFAKLSSNNEEDLIYLAKI